MKILTTIALFLGTMSSSYAIVKGQHVKYGTPIAQATVALYNSQTGTFCSGTLIDSHWVLTAAHCLSKEWKTLSGNVKPRDISVIFGEFDATNVSGITAGFVIKHPEFGEAARVKYPDRNDVALVRFDSKLPRGFVPVPLLSEEDYENMKPGTEVILAGFGMTSLRDHSTDKKLFSFATTYQSSDEEFRVARLVPHEGKPGGNCPGDSGGPAFLNLEGKLYVFGVASTAEVSCEKFGEYGNIAHYKDWVTQTIEQNTK